MDDLLHEIKNGPLAEELAPYLEAGNDTAIVSALNSKTIDHLGWVSRIQFIQWSAATGMAAKIKDASLNLSTDPLPVALRSIALSILSVANGGGPLDLPGINFGNPANVDALNLWVTAGLLSTPNKNILLAMATTKISRAEFVFGRDITIYDVASSVRDDTGTRRELE